MKKTQKALAKKKPVLKIKKISEADLKKVVGGWEDKPSCHICVEPGR